MKILCAEGLWDNEISTRRTSYKSVIDLVSIETGCDTSYFSFTTGKELENIFRLFYKNKYNIFYLASHMNDGYIVTTNGADDKIDLLEVLSGHSEYLKNKVLHLAGCSSLAKQYSFPNLKLLSGYKIDTDTTESSAMDLLYLVTLLNEGKQNLYSKLCTRYPDLIRASGFYIFDGKESQ